MKQYTISEQIDTISSTITRQVVHSSTLPPRRVEEFREQLNFQLRKEALRYRPGSTALRTWLFRIGTKRARNMLRDMQTDKRKVNLLTVTTPYPEENSLSGIPAGSVNWVETQILTPAIAALCTDVRERMQQLTDDERLLIHSWGLGKNQKPYKLPWSDSKKHRILTALRHKFHDLREYLTRP